MADFTDAQGNPIAPDQLAAKVSSGEAFGDPSAEYTMRDGTGNVVKVLGSDVPKALGGGMSLLQPEEAAFEARRGELEGQTLRTIGERAASAASFGLSDVAAREFAPGYADDMAARARANDAAGTIGNLLGTAVPLSAGGKLAKGIDSLVGARGGAMGRMASRVSSGAVAGTIDGALYGAGGAAGEAALKNEELTAEKVLSGAGRGALMGGLLGGVGGGLGYRAEQAASKLRGVTSDIGDKLMQRKLSKLEDAMRKRGAAEDKIAAALSKETAKLEARGGALQQFAADAAVKSLDIDPRLARSHASRAGTSVDDLIRDAGSDYLNYTMQTGPLAGKRIFHGARRPLDVVDDVQHAVSETRYQVALFERQADQAATRMPDLLPDSAPIRERVTSTLRGDSKRAPTAFEREVAADLAPVLVEFDRVPISQLRQASDAIDARLADTTSKVERAKLTDIRRTLNDAAAESTEAIFGASGLDATQYADARRVNRSLSFVADALDEMKLDTVSKGHDSGLTGYALVSALTGNFPTSIAAGASMLASNILRERAGGITAEIAHRVANSDVRLGWGAKTLAGDAWSGARHRAYDITNAEPLMRAVQDMTVNPEATAKFAAQQVAPYAAQYPQIAGPATMKIMGDLAYLASKIPAPVGRSGASLTPGAVTSFRTPREAIGWMQRVAALEDPGIVVDSVLEGKIPREAIETLKERRPLVWEELRQQVMTETAAKGTELPYKRRITLGLAFDFTSDKSLMPGTLRAIQASTVTMPAQPGPKPTNVTSKAMDQQADAMSLPSEGTI